MTFIISAAFLYLLTGIVCQIHDWWVIRRHNKRRAVEDSQVNLAMSEKEIKAITLGQGEQLVWLTKDEAVGKLKAT